MLPDAPPTLVSRVFQSHQVGDDGAYHLQIPECISLLTRTDWRPDVEAMLTDGMSWMPMSNMPPATNRKRSSRMAITHDINFCGRKKKEIIFKNIDDDDDDDIVAHYYIRFKLTVEVDETQAYFPSYFIILLNDERTSRKT